MKLNLIKKPVIFGVLAGTTLIFLYSLILTLTQSLSHAIEQFLNLWYLILPLVLGFGFQVFLYSFIREQLKEKKSKSMTGKLVASGGVSTVSMVACCAHHLVDFLPILGLSALFLFLAEYQTFFILIGIISNVIGIIMMLETIKKHSLYQENSKLGRIVGFINKPLKNSAIIISILVLLISFISIRNKRNQETSDFSAINNSTIKDEKKSGLAAQINDENGLSIEAEPIDFSFDKPLQIKLSFTTHQGSLDFDLTKQAKIIDDKNNEYLPQKWQGGMGGHHLSGILVFPKIEKTEGITLVIKDVYGVKERDFSWDL